jgi:hypothetical protein
MANTPVRIARYLYIAASIWFETTQTEQALDVSHVTAPIRRLVVSADQDDPNFRQAQESIVPSSKDEKTNLSLKKIATPAA